MKKVKFDTAEFKSAAEAVGLGEWVQEHRFHPTRKWKFDWANPENKIAMEQEGGIWIYGRHNRPSSMLKDMEKYNNAAALGWRVLKFTPQEFEKNVPLSFLKMIYEQNAANNQLLGN